MASKKKSRETSQRKIEHLLICANEDVENTSYFGDIVLLHNALPEIDKKKIDLRTAFLGKELSAPLLIASMTGGHPETKKVNEALAEAAEKTGIGLGIGSQRAALEDEKQANSFTVVRKKAPNAFIYANIGVPQLRKYGIEGVERVIEMIDADAVAIHLNFLQEAVQPDGDIDASGCLDAIKEVCRAVKKPVIVKETGAGISREVALLLRDAGVSAIDAGGMGGTSFAPVEAYRARARKEEMGENLGETFRHWGIPTPVSIVECTAARVPIIATGGVRTGLDIAKSLALGASVASAALPFLKPAMKSALEVVKKINFMVEELRVAMFLTGCSSVEKLKSAEFVITGQTRDILGQRQGKCQ
jgi:isopentenyl-diphosphate delta-isomerase